jgi:hypothetical protein
MIVSSNKTISTWAKTFGDPVAVASMVNRLVHHAEVIVLKGRQVLPAGKGEEMLTGSKRSCTCSGLGRRYLLRFEPAMTSWPGRLAKPEPVRRLRRVQTARPPVQP